MINPGNHPSLDIKAFVLLLLRSISVPESFVVQVSSLDVSNSLMGILAVCAFVAVFPFLTELLPLCAVCLVTLIVFSLHWIFGSFIFLISALFKDIDRAVMSFILTLS